MSDATGIDTVKEVHKHQKFLEAVLDNIEVGIVACDAAGTLTFFNRATRILHGLSEEPIGPDEWAEHYDLYLADGKTLMQKEDIPLFKALKGEHIKDIEMMIIPKGKPAITVIASAQPIYAESGEMLGAVGVIHNISDLKLAKDQLRIANEELEDKVRQRTSDLNDSNESLQIAIEDHRLTEQDRERLIKVLADKTKEMESLLRIVTHDLRSPLINIQGFSKELASECKHIKRILSKIQMGKEESNIVSAAIEENIPEAIDYITKSVEKMDRLLGGLSQLSRSTSITLNIESLEMNSLTQNVIEACRFQAKKVEAAIDCDALPDCMGDERQIDQVFSNLINNAIKYLDPEKKGIIRITGSTENGMSIYCVEDNGIGIPENHKDKVFQIFHRVNSKCPAAGEGLGLSTVKMIVQRNNGTVWLESEEGKGSKFYVSLPVAKP
jgi:PAS domain S-box-containing protein